MRRSAYAKPKRHRIRREFEKRAPMLQHAARRLQEEVSAVLGGTTHVQRVEFDIKSPRDLSAKACKADAKTGATAYEVMLEDIENLLAGRIGVLSASDIEWVTRRLAERFNLVEEKTSHLIDPRALDSVSCSLIFTIPPEAKTDDWNASAPMPAVFEVEIYTLPVEQTSYSYGRAAYEEQRNDRNERPRTDWVGSSLGVALGHPARHHEWLSPREILDLAKLATQTLLDRTALLASIDPALAQAIPIANSPAAQHQCDLNHLNRMPQLDDGTVPLRRWLETALALLGPRPEADKVRHALAQCDPDAVHEPNESLPVYPTEEPLLRQTTFQLAESVADAERFQSALPVYDLAAFAGAFSTAQAPEPVGWARVKTTRAIDRNMFVARIVGESMEPAVPDGSWAIFRVFPAGTEPPPTALDGRRVIVQLRDDEDPETGGRYAFKRWRVTKLGAEGEVVEVELRADNPAFSARRFQAEDGELRVVAEFVEVVR